MTTGCATDMLLYIYILRMMNLATVNLWQIVCCYMRPSLTARSYGLCVVHKRGLGLTFSFAVDAHWLWAGQWRWVWDFMRPVPPFLWWPLGCSCFDSVFLSFFLSFLTFLMIGLCVDDAWWVNKLIHIYSNLWYVAYGGLISWFAWSRRANSVSSFWCFICFSLK